MPFGFYKRFFLFCLTLFSPLVYAVTFIDIWEYKIDGVKSINEAAIQQAVYPYLGAARSLEDVEQVTREIQQLYRQAGMPTVSVEVPEQDIVNGIVRIQVTESRVRRVTVVGSRYFLLDDIKNSFPSLRKGRALNVTALQEDVQKANQANKNLRVVPALKAGPAPGLVDVDLNVADEFPLHGGVEITNYHTENTTPTRLSADIGYGNLWQRNHEASVQIQTTPENTNEVNVLAASYLLPVDDHGGKLALYGVLSDSELAAVNDITVNGEGEIFGLRWVKPLSKSRAGVHSFSLGFDYKDFKEELVLIDSSELNTPVSYTTFSSQYSYFGRRKKGSDSVSIGMTFGSGLLDNEAEFNGKRAQADSNFVLWKLDWDRRYGLPKRWAFNHRLRAQLTSSPLLSNEQLSAGGINSARGYFESQISGDKGYIVNLEFSRPFFDSRWDWLDQFSTHLYYDTSTAYLNEALANQDDSVSIESMGIGIKFSLLNHWKFKTDSAVILKDEGTLEEGDVKLHASGRYEF